MGRCAYNYLEHMDLSKRDVSKKDILNASNPG